MKSAGSSLRGIAFALVAGLALVVTAAPVAMAQPAASPVAAGLKKTVAVDVFGGAELTAGLVAADGLTAILTDVLIRDGRFVVVERQALGSIQSEQQLGQGGSATVETAAQGNRLIGASYLVKGAITKYNPAAGGGGLSIGGLPSAGGFGLGAGARTRKATVSISLRVIDTTTGQIIATVNAEGAATSQETDAGLVNGRNGSTLGASAFRGTSLGKAVEDAIRKAVDQIALDLGGVPWSGLVVDNRNGTIYLNAGSEQNVQPGMVFGVYRQGEVLTDPGTGAVLDVAIERLGSVRVDTVREKISIGQIVDGQQPARGDLLKSE